MKNAVRAILVLVVACAVLIQSRPDRFRVERSATVTAPAEAVYGQVSDFHRWAAWSPWDKIDPTMQRTFEGPASGVGAVYRWQGTGRAGAGSMKITGATPGSLVAIDLEFLKPFQASNVTTFTFTPDVAGTKVTWVMEGKNNFVAKAMSVFMNMDKMIGPDFERGLASLKTVAESAPTAGAPAAADTTAPGAPKGKSAK